MKKLIIFILLLILTQSLYAGEMRIFKIKHSNARDICAVVNGLKSPGAKISFDANSNSIIVSDTQANLERIASVINQLDVATPQVQIKVVVADVSNAFLEAIGMRSAQVIIPQGEFSAVLDLLKSRDDSNMRSQMQVTTLSNQPASLEVSEDEIFGYEFTRYNSGREIVKPIIKPVGNFLEVLPVVNNDNTINVTLRPTMSNVNSQGLPNQRTVLTQIIVNDGDTIAIGGVNQSRVETRSTSTPVLGIPLSKTKQNEQKNVVMFLTATATD